MSPTTVLIALAVLLATSLSLKAEGSKGAGRSNNELMGSNFCV
jgi:hypothetical protein